MDKVREILGVLKKHHFWIFSVVVGPARSWAVGIRPRVR